jgi:hypothetical protein
MRRETYEDDTLLGTFPDDIDDITRGYYSVLPTPEDTPTSEEVLEASSSAEPVSKPKSKPKRSTVRASNDIVGGISDLNLLDRRRTRKPTEKARQQFYIAALSNTDSL